MLTKEIIEKYFNAEKNESLLFLGIGVAAILVAFIFFFYLKTGFHKGAAIPLLLVGLLLGIVGFTVYNRSDADRIRNVYALDMNPQDLKEKELPRMKTVMKNFVLYRYIEIVLAITGIVLFVYFKNDEAAQNWKGIGAGIAIMALITLGADYFAEKRGKVYINALAAFTEKL